MRTIEQNETHTLAIEFMGRRHGGHWLELIERATGRVKILTATDKSVFDGVTIEHAMRWTANDEWKPMYKKGV